MHTCEDARRQLRGAVRCGGQARGEREPTAGQERERPGPSGRSGPRRRAAAREHASPGREPFLTPVLPRLLWAAFSGQLSLDRPVLSVKDALVNASDQHSPPVPQPRAGRTSPCGEKGRPLPAAQARTRAPPAETWLQNLLPSSAPSHRPQRWGTAPDRPSKPQPRPWSPPCEGSRLLSRLGAASRPQMEDREPGGQTAESPRHLKRHEARPSPRTLRGSLGTGHRGVCRSASAIQSSPG